MSLLDNLLDQNISEIDDLPSYKVPPVGFYKLLIKKAEQKTFNISNDREAPGLALEYEILEVIDLKNPSAATEINRDENGRINQIFNEAYMFIPGGDAEKTKQAIKTAFKEVATKLGLSTLAEVVNNLEGLEVFATVENRKDKNDAERVYAKVSNVKPV